MPQHVRMRFEAKPRALSCPFYHFRKTRRGERSAALGSKNKQRLRLLFALKATQSTQFIAGYRMSAWRALLYTANM
jgi:hypothetical protein